MGQTNLGHLLGAGCQADIDVGLILLFIGYMALANGFSDRRRGAPAGRYPSACWRAELTNRQIFC